MTDWRSGIAKVPGASSLVIRHNSIAVPDSKLSVVHREPGMTRPSPEPMAAAIDCP